MELIILVYFGLLEVALGSQLVYNALYERKKRKLGYVNLEGPALKTEVLMHPMAFILSTFVPFLNLYWLYTILRFKKVSKDDLDVEIKEHIIEEVDKVEQRISTYSEANHNLALKVLKVRKAQVKYKKRLAKKEENHAQLLMDIESTHRDLSLPEKVVRIRRIQEKSDMVNRIKPFSEYSIDEKIAMYLSELEIAYREKAQEEGIDYEQLDEEIALLLDGKNCFEEKNKKYFMDNTKTHKIIHSILMIVLVYIFYML